jgi:hypothetical protein
MPVRDCSVCVHFILTNQSWFTARLSSDAGPASVSPWSACWRGGESNRTSTTVLSVLLLDARRPSQVTVGSPSRARVLASLLDDLPKPLEVFSERGFLTITGRYRGTPISIVSIGMGYPNMDFFVREVRECLIGDMVVVRLVEVLFLAVCFSQSSFIRKDLDHAVLSWMCQSDPS